MKTVWVSELDVRCSLPMNRQPSRNCLVPAVGAVLDNSDGRGRYYFRCVTHLNIITNFGGPTGHQQIMGMAFAEIPEEHT